MVVFQLLGFAGTIIIAVAYLPQLVHLVHEHCSAGISVRAWLMWLLGSALIFLHAVNVVDPVFITLQALNIVAILLIVFYARKYKLQTCASHKLIKTYSKYQKKKKKQRKQRRQ